MDDLFAEAMLAAAAPEWPSAATTSLEAARQLHAAWRRTKGAATAALGEQGACSSTVCTSVTRYDLHFFATTATDASTALASVRVDESRVHACVGRALCTLAMVHGVELTARAVGVVAEVHWCARHARMHACLVEQCPLGELDSLGTRTCALSGRRLAATIEHAFGDGVSSLRGDSQRRADDDLSRRALQRVRRREEPAVGSALLASKRPRVGDAGDFPSSTTFPSHVADNTFATGIEENLAQFYAAAYHCVHRLIFSVERANIERAKEQHVRLTANKRVARYIRQQRRNKEPIVESVCQQYVDQAYRRRRLFDRHLVGKDSIARLTAYWALVAMECYIQLNALTARVREGARKKTRESADRLGAYPIDHVVANVLDLMASAYSHSERTIIAREPWLSLYPESMTIKALGIPQGVCTAIKKDMYVVLGRALDIGVPLEHVQTTFVAPARILFCTDDDDRSVVQLFLRARKQRLGL